MKFLTLNNLNDNLKSFLTTVVKPLINKKAKEVETYVNNKVIVAKNVKVTADNWVSDSTYSDYPYKAELSIENVTANHSPDVRFNFTEASNGKIAPISDTSEGIVTIYSNDNTLAFTIPVIILTAV